MEKKRMADKLAEKAFHSKKIQESWQIHAGAFGPILEPAFAEDYKTRIDLTAALNKISTRNIKGGLDMLMKLKPACQCDADHAAWFFFVGLAFEMAGAKDQMIQMYQQSNQFGHSFYLPYAKVAKAAHADGVFEVAEENYADAIRCLEEGVQDRQSATILASLCTNYASCLTMMHRYRDAELALKKSIAFLQYLPNRAATQAILAAAMKDVEETAKYLRELEQEESAVFSQTKKMTDEILKGEHPHFAAISLTEEQIEAFWNWFGENEEELAEKIKANAHDDAFALLQSQLKGLFPYMQRDPDCAFEQREEQICITFADYFMVSLEKSYQRLMAACPDEYKSRWCFELVH